MWTPGVSITKASEEIPGMELPISLKARTLNLYMMPHRMLSSIVLVSAPSVWVTITQFPGRDIIIVYYYYLSDGTCGQIVHLHRVAEDGAAAVRGGSDPVQVDGVGDAAAGGLVALQVGQAHHRLARLARHVVQRQP